MTAQFSFSHYRQGYAALMRVLCLSKEEQLLRQVETVFSQSISELTIEHNSSRFADSAISGDWDAFLVDFDALPPACNPVEFVTGIASQKPLLVIGSFDFANWHSHFRQFGALVLHKPTSAGEIGLALRRLKAT
jgi:hypothetical protein